MVDKNKTYFTGSKPIFFEKTVEYKYILEFLGGSELSPLSGEHEVLGDGIQITNSNWLLIEFKRGSSDFNTEWLKYIPAASFAARKTARSALVESRRVIEEGDSSEEALKTCDSNDKIKIACDEKIKIAMAETLHDLTSARNSCIEKLQTDPGNATKIIPNEPHYFVYGDMKGSEGAWQLDVLALNYIGTMQKDRSLAPFDPSELQNRGWPFEEFKDYALAVYKAKQSKNANGGGGESEVELDYSCVIALNGKYWTIMTKSEFDLKYLPASQLGENLRKKLRMK